MSEDLNVHIIDHPLIQHKLTRMRMKDTSYKDFRELLEEIAMLMAYEITRDLPLKEIEIETPVAPCRAKDLIPTARVGHIGLYRDPKTLKPIEYYCKLPPNPENRIFIVVDPMLATGGSSAAALTMLKKHGAKKLVLMCLVSAPEGVRVVNKEHPDVPIYTAAVDEKLNDHGYIVPGLGDAGDRIFGTL